jgi:hypothetical protein
MREDEAPPAVDRVDEIRGSLNIAKSMMVFDNKEGFPPTPYLSECFYLLSALDKANTEIAELRAELEAVKVERDRYRGAIEKAPHALLCKSGGTHDEDCTCWKWEALK